MKPILKVNDLTVSVENRVLIKHLKFQILPGTLTCITGENGVGKSTLVKTLLKAHHTPAVEFLIPRSSVSIVPQFRNVSPDYPLTVSNFVSLGFQRHWRPWLTRNEKEHLKQILKQCNLIKIANEPLGEASGGEQQRVYLAQALVTNPKLLILDETTASLDTIGKLSFMKNVVEMIKDHQLAVLFITHDPELVKKFGDYQLEIKSQHGQMTRIKEGAEC